MMDLYEELRALIRSLNDAGTEFALCGGLAIAVHGKVRATIDIDLLVPPESLEAAIAVCRERGFTIGALPMVFAGGRISIRRFTKADESGEALSVDLLIVADALQNVWQTRQKIAWEGSELPVVSRDGLIEMKRLRGSGQDLEDIEWLESERD